jgi:hypothetical protein
LEFPTHAKHKFFAFGLQLSAPKVEGWVQKTLPRLF